MKPCECVCQYKASRKTWKPECCKVLHRGWVWVPKFWWRRKLNFLRWGGDFLLRKYGQSMGNSVKYCTSKKGVKYFEVRVLFNNHVRTVYTAFAMHSVKMQLISLHRICYASVNLHWGQCNDFMVCPLSLSLFENSNIVCLLIKEMCICFASLPNARER